MRIISVGSAFPPHYVDQETLLTVARQMVAGHYFNPARLEQIHRNVLVGGRYFSLPLEELATLNSFSAANDHWIRVAQDIGGAAVLQALAQAGLGVQDVDAIFFVTVTGVAAPSIDARLINRLGFRPDIKRIPIFGLGCLAGAAGIARAADYVRAFPNQVAILLSVELCSLTLQRQDLSIPNLIATGLFGDGAACAVVVGADRAERGPSVLATRSVFYPNTEDVMGWQIGSSGFKIILSSEVPDMVHRHLRGDVERFLTDQQLKLSDISTYIVHPGGPKVLQAMETALELPSSALARTWDSLRRVGNLSSSSVLLVLKETLADTPPAPGSYGLLLAMGPGFCSELVLLQW
jgi:alkylresorcinol/alkylpyrone synthase